MKLGIIIEESAENVKDAWVPLINEPFGSVEEALDWIDANHKAWASPKLLRMVQIAIILGPYYH